MIVFNRPTSAPGARQRLESAMASGKLSGDGPSTQKASEMLSELHDGAKVLLTTSCTHALEISALLLDLSPGDEVIVPSFTFVSTANAFVQAGATPVFVDIRRDTLNIDEAQVAAAVTERTRAIVPVHYAGVGCEMESLGATARLHGLTVIEDNAHGLFARRNGRPLGTFGAMSTLSFHETKNISTGEGGALVINDEAFVERAEIIREKGTNRSRFFRGQVDKYTWVDIGSSYLPSELVAAMLVAQLEQAALTQQRRSALWWRYQQTLGDWAQEQRVVLPLQGAPEDGAYHMFQILLPDLAARTAFISHLREREVMSVFHYVPLHSSPMGAKVGRTPFGCPITDDISDRLARLPLFTDMTAVEQQQVIDAIVSFRVQA